MSLGDHITAKTLHMYFINWSVRAHELMVKVYNKDEHCVHVRSTEVVLVCECWRASLATKAGHACLPTVIFYDCPESVLKKDKAIAAESRQLRTEATLEAVGLDTEAAMSASS